MDNLAVSMQGITKIFNGVKANDNVDFNLRKGSIHGLLGENGAGKTTLMNILYGLYQQEAGDIYINGSKEEISSPIKAISLGIGMVHQHFMLARPMTVVENVMLGKKSRRGILLDTKETATELKELADKYKMNIDPYSKIWQLSVGEQQRVEILTAIYQGADILILDEPTAVLTPQEANILFDMLRHMKADGKSIILITHKLEEIKKVADRCAILNRGRLIDVLDVKETSTKKMASLMVGREVSFETPKKEPSFGREILRVENMTVVNQDQFEVVKDVSFSVRGGEIFAIAGVAGNGQIELADAIAGLLPVHKGKIWLNGKDITGESIRQRSLEGISYIPEDRQNYGVVMDFTLSENLGLRNYFKEPFSRKGILNKKAFDSYAETLIDKYDIRSGQGVRTVVRSMSGGNQQKAIIAREVEQESDLMIFVQPTRGLDIGAIENIRRQMIGERDKGKAILLISLELDEIMDCADTIGVIYNGQMQKKADAKTLTTNEVGEFMMGVKRHA